jgi:hypothetical protein
MGFWIRMVGEAIGAIGRTPLWMAVAAANRTADILTPQFAPVCGVKHVEIPAHVATPGFGLPSTRKLRQGTQRLNVEGRTMK